MPSSLTRVLSFVLGFSPRPPASVCGTGTLTIVSAFSCQRGFTCFATLISLPIAAQLTSAYFTTDEPNHLDRLYHQPAHAILLRPRLAHKGGTGISTSCPSPGLLHVVRKPVTEEWYPNSGSTASDDTASLPPTYPVHPLPIPNDKLQ